MKLTDKALEHFERWFWINYTDFRLYYDTKLSILRALIIEFFDSVNIFINIKSKFGQRKQCERFSFSVKGQSSGFRYNSRQEATEKAILTANKIYNETI